MADLALTFGGDLSVSPTGDIALSDGTTLTQQRVLRRLLTNHGGYIWQLGYGAGLAQFVGQPAAPAAIQAIVALLPVRLDLDRYDFFLDADASWETIRAAKAKVAV